MLYPPHAHLQELIGHEVHIVPSPCSKLNTLLSHVYTPAPLPCCALTDQVSLAAHSGPHPNLMCRLVSRFFLQQCVGVTPEPNPSSTQHRDDAFYGFSPLSCKARGQRLLWISHALTESSTESLTFTSLSYIIDWLASLHHRSPHNSL